MSRNALPALVDDAGFDPKGPSKSSPKASPSGRGTKIKIVLAAVCIIAAGVLTYLNFAGQVDPGSASRRRTLVDSVTSEVFVDFGIKDGDSFPYENPKTGQRTLFPAEKCYWTKDGSAWKAKREPTYVLLNEYAGKKGDTICPDCGRKVVPHNPAPPMEMMNQAAGGGS